MAELNGYELSKAWFDFAFENQDKVRPAHTSLYCYIVDLWNRLGHSKAFGLPTEVTMAGSSIGNYKTYATALNDLSEFGFINIITRSKNQYTSNTVALVKTSKASTKALTKAVYEPLNEAVAETPYQSTTQSTDRSSDGINKPVNLKPETLNVNKKEDGQKMDGDGFNALKLPNNHRTKFGIVFHDAEPSEYLRSNYQAWYEKVLMNNHTREDGLEYINDKMRYEEHTDIKHFQNRFRTLAESYANGKYEQGNSGTNGRVKGSTPGIRSGKVKDF
jgi:hypothetical protein